LKRRYDFDEEVVNVTDEKLYRKIFSASQRKSLGLSYPKLSRLVKSGEIERMARGVYETADSPDDMMYIGQLRRPKIIYSHGTALYLHDLTDHDPVKFSVSVPAGYNTKSLRKDGFKVFSLKPELYESDVIQLPTRYGNPVNTYSSERTVCDVVRRRGRIDPEIVITAVKRYAERRDRNIPQLMRTAERLGVGKIFKAYLEVLT
jgi:predicted transcriptional regulator of viral defense system